jgi:hypothetical protein
VKKFKKNDDLKSSYDELFKKANDLFPGLSKTLKSFNNTKVSVEDYENYLKMINSQPLSTSSNRATN